jgi:alpha amylase-like protein
MMAPALEPSRQFDLRAHPNLYEINTWAWLEQLSAWAGREINLASVPDSEWDSFAQLGFDIVWLMGVWQRSPESRRMALADPRNVGAYARALPGWTPADVVGSPYAVKQYVPDPRIGTWDDLDRAREKLRERGVALFLDFVGNHTAVDHPWTHEHPEFYVQGTERIFEGSPESFFQVTTPRGIFYLTHARDPYFPPWTDTAQLNHFNPEMRAAQIADLRNIARHCDGVRCDMAMLHLRDIFARIWGPVLNDAKPPEREFWEEAHQAVPALILLAEAYWGTEERLLDLGFSYVYDKELYDAVRDADAERVRTRLSSDVKQQSRFARFLENHDEPRSVDVFGKQRLPTIALLMGTVPGMRFYYQGELQGCAPHLPITLRIPSDEPPDPVCVEIFAKVLGIANQAIFHQGDWRLLEIASVGDATFRNLIAYEWRLAEAWKVLAVNLKPEPAQAWVRFRDATLGGGNYIFYDELHDVRYPRKGDDLSEKGLFVRLDGFQAHLFDVSVQLIGA